MSAIRILATEPWVQRLGLTLLHFVWQGAIIAAIYGAARGWSARSRDARYRYFLGCAALTAMAIVPVTTWLLLPGAVHPSLSASFTGSISAPVGDSVPSIPFIYRGGTHAPLPMQFMPWVVALWLAGATAFLLRLLGGWMLALGLRYRMVRAASAEWQRTFERLKARISVTRRVRLLVSGVLDSPAVIGWLRPIVLVPAGALAGLPSEQMEALLFHELAHIRRHDYLVQILQSVIEAVFFYHPGVWWISGHMHAEREVCCDDIVVSITGDAAIYARALAEVDSARFARPALVAANSGSVAHRIARLLGQPVVVRKPFNGAPTVTALTLAVIAAWAVFAQPAGQKIEIVGVQPSTRSASAKSGIPVGDARSTFGVPEQSQPATALVPARQRSAPPLTVTQAAVTVNPFETPSDAPAFESVSIGPCQAEERSFSSYSHSGRLRMNCQTLRDLIRSAYVSRSSNSQKRLQIDEASGPSWINSDRFTVQAMNADINPDPQSILAPMLRTVLEERFHLKFHYEDRQAPVYALSVASGGLKMRPFQEGSCIPLNLMLPPAPGVNYCRSRGAINGSLVSVDAQGMSIDDLRMIYLPRLNRPLVDKTGLTGRFDFHLVFAQTFSSKDAGPTIVTAMREQLGLQLEPDYAPLKFLVVDSAERPAGN